MSPKNLRKQSTIKSLMVPSVVYVGIESSCGSFEAGLFSLFSALLKITCQKKKKFGKCIVIISLKLSPRHLFRLIYPFTGVRFAASLNIFSSLLLF